jgi:hypothetical protein
MNIGILSRSSASQNGQFSEKGGQVNGWILEFGFLKTHSEFAERIKAFA